MNIFNMFVVDFTLNHQKQQMDTQTKTLVIVAILAFFCSLVSASSRDSKTTQSTAGTTIVSMYPNNANDIGSFLNPQWNNRYLGGIESPNGNYADAALAPGETSQHFFPYDYRFVIPCNAVITNVTVEVTRRNTLTGDLVDAEVRLRLDDYTLSPTNMASANVWLESTTSNETVSYSDPTWGTILTPEILNSELFGVIISTTNIDGTENAQAEIDAINVIVCYDIAGTTAYEPIIMDVTKQPDICSQGIGSITISASGGSGNFEYSIDGGITWTTNSSFSGLLAGNYRLMVRNSADGSCQTKASFCMIALDDKIIQPGDAIIACKPASDDVTLVVESIQPFFDLYNSGYQGEDVSCLIEPIQTSYTTADLCGPVFSLALDEERNIYTGATSLYGIGGTQAPVVSMIDGTTGAVTKLATLPGNYGIAGVDYNVDCDEIYAANLDDGMIYRLDASTGNILSSYDPLGADNGAAGLATLGERIMAVTYNPEDGRLYYSVWANDVIDNANRNTIRSVEIDPNSCNILSGTDVLEVELPWLSEACGRIDINYSMPVSDIEFSADGTTMLLSEVGFNSNIPINTAHHARLLEYDGSSTAWTLDTNGNTNNCKYRIGYNLGTNSRGGVDFGYAGTDGTNCTQGDESFVVNTGDALSGITCYAEGCYYGLQYIDATAGGNQFTSVILDMDRDQASQTKSVYGDVDILLGCSENEVFCSLTITHPTCTDSNDGSITVTGSGGSGNYEYSLDGGATYQSSNTFATLTVGAYTITIRDVNMVVCTSTCLGQLIAQNAGGCLDINVIRN